MDRRDASPYAGARPERELCARPARVDYLRPILLSRDWSLSFSPSASAHRKLTQHNLGRA